MNYLITIIHLFFVFFFGSIPFWHKSYLKYGLYLPLILSIIWIIFNGCPLTKIDPSLNDEDFLKVAFDLIGINIDQNRLRYATYCYLLLVTIIASNKYYSG